MPAAQVDTKEQPALVLSAGRSSAVVDLSLFAAISLLGAALRLLSVEQWSFGLEEAATFRAVTQPVGAGAGELFGSEQGCFPAAFLWLRWLLGSGVLPGFSEGWMRLPFAFAGCLLPPLIALLARPLFGRGVAFLAALLVAVHPAQIAASQTAHPAVCAVTLVVAAAVAARGGWRWVGWLLVLLAGACHPIGWLAGAGMLYAVSSGRLLARTPRFVWWLLGVHVIVLAPMLIDQAGLSVVVLASIALFMRSAAADNQRLLGLGLAALFPLVSGGVWWWLDRTASQVAILAALPAMTLLASWSLVSFYRAMRQREVGALGPGLWGRRVLAVAPALMVLGELLTSTFLYFMVYGGGRAPWRDVRDAVLAALRPGHKIELVAARGLDVMRVYLRPSHWQVPPDPQQPSLDPHPGVRVSLLSEDLDAARALLANPDAQLVLQRDEWLALLAAEGGAQLVDGLVIQKIWPNPQPSGDRAIYLLGRQAPQKED